jgi:hypothetical protein
MTTEPEPERTLYQRALDHRCPTCKAEPGEPCNAPRKIAEAEWWEARVRVRLVDQAARLHVTRQDRAVRKRDRDRRVRADSRETMP